MKNKKSVGMYIFLAVILAGCCFIMFLFREKPLKRDRDNEFAAGSGIEIGQISTLQEESLYKLCKVWGFVKYHHPSAVDGSVNWDGELFRVMPEILEAEDGQEANEVLYQWLSRFPFELEENSQAKLWKQIQEEEGIEVLDTSWILDKEFLGEDLQGYLEKLSHTYLTDRENAYGSFKKSSVYVEFKNERMMDVKPEDDGVKLLALFRFWNMYEYYSPNVSITEVEWDEALKMAIPEIIEADSYKEYVLAIAKTAARTADAHITLSDREDTLTFYYGKYFLPCNIKVVDGQLVVAQTAEGEGKLQKGDVIQRIDGRAVSERIEELSQYTALPQPDKVAVKMGWQLLETENSQAAVQVLRGENEIELQVEARERATEFKNPFSNGWLEQGEVGYIDPSALKEGEAEKLMEEFAEARGIIIDLRYYPSVPLMYLLGEYIIPEPKVFALVTFPNQAIPGSFCQLGNPSSGAGTMKTIGEEKEYPFYEGKVVLLMDETSMSQSEFTIMALRQAPNIVVVGSNSIGADGNVVKLSLPGNIVMKMTGLGIYTPDGKPTQKVGLEPDILCCPTVEGIAAGRDELVEKAIEIIRQ